MGVTVVTTYYANPTTGNNANAGTAGSPKKDPQVYFDGATLAPGDIVEIQTGTHNISDFTFLLRLTNYKRGNASNYITLQGAAGCTINMGNGGSGIEGYGSCRFLRFKNLVINVRQATGSSGAFNEGIFFNGRETTSDKNGPGTGTGSNQNPDGQGAAHISAEGCTIKGVGSSGSGTGYLGRNVFACIGGDYLQVLNCSLSYGAENDIGGGGSGISIHQPYSYDTTPGIHVRLDGNKIFMMGNPATANPASDRNGIILDEYHTTGGFGDPLIDHRLVGDTYIANNIIINTAGRGIHVLKGGLADSQIIVVNNTVVAPFGYSLGGSVPFCGIGGYGQGLFHHYTFFNNLVYGDQARFNYDFLSWDNQSGALAGARNWSYNGSNQFSPPSTEPSGWLYSTANPQLINPTNNGTGNYAPQAGSPLISAGLASFNGWNAPTLDFNGATRTGGITIGAIQINSGAGTAPTANFTFSPATPGAGSQVTFTDTSSGTPNSFQWNFGDGTTSLVANPVKIFATAGTFQVAHTVSNTFGSNTVTKTVTVAPAGGGGTPTQPGTAVDLFALFNSMYPCAASLIWVSGSGNDSNPGTQSAPKQTIQGAMNAAGAGTRIMVRPGTYAKTAIIGKNATNSNWIQVVAEPGARIQSNGDGQGSCFEIKGSSFIAIYGFEMTGIYAGGDDIYEVAIYCQQNAHSIAMWNCHVHNFCSHAFATSGAARFDVCYNRLHHLAKWNHYQTSAISSISMPNVGSAAADGYHNHVIGNVIDAIWVEPSAASGSAWGITDGNGLILDYSGGYAGRTLVAHNLIVGCGGRAVHALGTDHVDCYLNTSCDNSQNIDGTEIGEYSIVESTDCRFAWNVGAARAGSNRLGVYRDRGTSTWSDTVFLRGTGNAGDPGDPSVTQYNNVNKTSTGPSGFFQQYQVGVHQQTSITNVAGFRPTAAQVATFSPSAALRALIAPWPDALGYLRPTSGNWAYGAFEATTATSGPPPDPPPGGGGTDPPPPSGTATNVEAESGTVGGGAAVVTDFAGYLGTGYVGYFGNTGDFNQVTVLATTAGTYAFRIRYGNADPGSSQAQVRVLVNGTEVAILTLPHTASDWSDTTRFQHTDPVNIQLNAGSNTVRIEHTGPEYSYADLDRYVFEGSDSGTPSGQPPVAAFAFSPQSPNVNALVSFVDQSTNTPTSWAWNFGDTTTSTTRSPTKAYAAAGVYTVSLTATNALGSNTVTHTVTVVASGGGGPGPTPTPGSYQHTISGSPLQNNTNYTVRVEVRDAQGLMNSDTEDFATSWTAPAAPTATASITNYTTLGYVDVTFTNSTRASDWVAWRVYRRLATPGAWELVEETRIDQASYSIKDYLARSGVAYEYTAVQVANRAGGEVESAYTATGSVSPTSTDYWLIVEDDPSFNIRLYHVVADTFRDEVQSEEHELIGRGRKVDIGTSLGYTGTLRFEIRDIFGGLTARQQRLNLEDLQRQTIYDVFLRNPFGDVFQVHTPSMSVERIAGVGMAEYVDCEFEYREVS